MMLDVSFFLLGLNVNSQAILYASFVNGSYMVNGQEVAISDVFGEDIPNWGAFNPALIQDGVGLVCNTDFPDSNIILVGDMFDLSRGPLTMVAECDLNDSSVALFGFSSTWVASNSQHVRFQMNGVNGSDAGEVLLIVKETDEVGFPGGAELGGLSLGMVQGVNRAAWTRTADGISLSINGGAVTNYPGAPYLGTEWTDLSGIFITGQGCILKEFSIYPVTDDAELRVLSAL